MTEYLRTVLFAHHDNGEGEGLRDLTARGANSEEASTKCPKLWLSKRPY